MKVNSLSHKSDMWPKRLNNLHTPPGHLFIRGEFDTSRPRVAIVGTRRCSQYGRFVTQHFASSLAAQGVIIVSGMAIGIDSVAHAAALDAGGQTIAILPSSLEHIYPRRHTGLAGRIAQNGALISEYAGHDSPQPYQFIARNRLVAAFADVLLVTEATIKSGTSHTVNFALELGIDVAGVPGPINSHLSEGTNHIIKNGGALVDSPNEVLELLGTRNTPSQSLEHPLSFSSVQEHILALLAQQPCVLDQLVMAIPSEDLHGDLLDLEMQGVIDRSSDGTYNLAKPSTARGGAYTHVSR